MALPSPLSLAPLSQQVKDRTKRGESSMEGGQINAGADTV